MKISIRTISNILLLLLNNAIGSGGNNPYLKEILMGRCYEEGPSLLSSTSSSSTCSDIVGSFMNVLESHLESDKELTAELFDLAYVGKVKFIPPKDKAMLRMGYFESTSNDKAEQNSENGSIIGSDISAFLKDGRPDNYWTTPEMTPGGRILSGLTFCAQSASSNTGCNRSDSTAYRQFWKAAYAEFAKNVKGKLVVVLEDPRVDEKFLRDAFLVHLNREAITQIDLWGVKCDSPVATATLEFLSKTAYGSAGKTTTCHGPDLVELALCYSNDGDLVNKPNDACSQYKKGGAGGSVGNVRNYSDDDGISPSSSSSTTWSPKPAIDDTDDSSPAATNDNIQEKKKKPFWRRIILWILLGIACHIYYKRYYSGGAGGGSYYSTVGSDQPQSFGSNQPQTYNV